MRTLGFALLTTFPCTVRHACTLRRAGEYDTAAELFRSALAGLAQPDRDLCLRLGRAGRLPECLGTLRPDELGEPTASLARALGPRELRESPGRAPGEAPRDLLGFPRCRRLLHKPVTLPCGLTVCGRCAEPGPDRPPGRRVSVVLSGLLEKCFPGRRLAGQARNLQRQRQPEAALAGCHQALDLAPGDNSLLLLQAELCLSMKNCEQALQDAGEVCQNEPLLPKGHHVKAQALSGLGRSKETLKEFLYCLALNPECNSVKKEAQKVLCEVFFPASENVPQNLTSSTQILLNTRLKAQSESVNSQGPVEDGGSAGRSKNPSEKPDVFRNSSSSVLHFILGLHCEEDQEVLDDILPTEPSTGLKRQFPNDQDAHDVNATGKFLKKEADSLPQRNVNSNTGESEELPTEVADFGCALCVRLLFEPVTMPCGHTFCLKCQELCLDHALHCPVCKEKLSELLASRNFNTTALAEELIFRYFSDELSERIYDEEMTELSHLTRDVPIFACAMAFPTVSCLLHVFEPRYRLMIRRCMETGTKRFGMCLSAEHTEISEYGCVQEVKDVRTFPDSSSVVDASGISRFRVLSHRHRDGYNTADIEYLEDERVEGPEDEELGMLPDPVYRQPASRLASLQAPTEEQSVSHFGLMPPDREPEPRSNPIGPAWSWWMLAVLPLEQKAQLAILGMISLKECLLAIRRILVIITREMNSWQELINSRERNS
ncbi:LOW QUALITY PROTEIN: LON peptidase N-terminal domain and RING finger protein 2 [Dama dama]